MADKISNTTIYSGASSEIADATVKDNEINIYVDTTNLKVKWRDASSTLNDDVLLPAAGAPGFSVYKPVGELNHGAVAPSISTISADVVVASFSNATTNDFIFTIDLVEPYSGSADLTADIYWASPTTSGNVNWQFDYGVVASGSSLPTTPAGNVTQTDAVAGSVNQVQITTLTLPGSAQSWATSTILNLKIKSDQSLNTTGSPAYFVGVHIYE